MAICGNCKESHQYAKSIRACYRGDLFQCDSLVKRVSGWISEEGEYESYDEVVFCGAEAIVDARGFECAVGHSHVYAEIRHAEGWEYAEDDNEASRLIKAGVEPRDLVTGGSFR